MALTIISPSITQGIANTIAADATNIQPQDWTNGVTDSADSAPTFDTKHAVFTSLPQNAASQSARIDNSQGTLTLTVTPTLSYTYTTGYSTEHEESKGFTVGITQDFSYEFAGIGGSTTLSASGTFNWTDSTGEDKTTSITDGVTATVEVPPHMMPAMFTCGRTAGWCAHILEQKRLGKLVRPAAIYTGAAPRRPEDVAGWGDLVKPGL